VTDSRIEVIPGYQFKQSDLLEMALTHRSYSRNTNNERLEFLGDSILNLIISIHIFQRFPELNEGQLSRIRASLVNQDCLARVATDINLGNRILLGGGELKSGGYRRASILSDAMEAVIAAIYMDSDFSQVQQVVLALYQPYLDRLSPDINLKDPKTRLQEYLQARKQELPQYAVEQIKGKSHDQEFTISCHLVESDLRTRGKGPSRKTAEQSAAQKMLENLTR